MKPENKTEEILNSLDGMAKATAPDFFYTRLKARMEKELGKKENLKRPWILRPVFAIATLGVILLVNAAVIFQGNDNSESTTIETDTYQAIAAEFKLNDTVLEEVYK